MIVSAATKRAMASSISTTFNQRSFARMYVVVAVVMITKREEETTEG
jgi:hypothetical protein